MTALDWRPVALRRGPALPCVYRLLGPDSQIVYVGRTKSWCRRIAQHRSLQPWWPQITGAEAVEIPDPDVRKAVEEGLIRDLQPPFNVQGGNLLQPRFRPTFDATSYLAPPEPPASTTSDGPVLFGIAELCVRWGISRQGLAKRRRFEWFPAAHQELAMGPVWTLPQIVAVETAARWLPVPAASGD